MDEPADVRAAARARLTAMDAYIREDMHQLNLPYWDSEEKVMYGVKSTDNKADQITIPPASEYDPWSVRVAAIVADDVRKLEIGRKKYRESWCKRGGREAAFNLSRKWDRIEQALARYDYDIFKAINLEPAQDGTIDGKDGLLDDIGDLRRYLLLVEEYVRRDLD